MKFESRNIIVTFIAVLLMTSSSLPAQAAMSSTGDSCTITGTSRGETLKGTKGRDVICGFGGNDKILGLGGNDVLDGGTGKDALSGGSGKDSLFGGKGKDSLNGNTGNDALVGGEDVDTSIGGGGLDTCEIGTGESRDISCSLLSNLAYLFETVSGQINSEVNFDGCAIMLFSTSFRGGRTAGGMIYGGGKFQFHAQDDLYNIHITVPDGSSGQEHKCQLKSSARIHLVLSGVYVVGPEVFLDISTPPLEKVTISVLNSNGTRVAGAPVKLETNPLNNCIVSVNQESACGTVGWIDNELQVADAPTSNAHKTSSTGAVSFMAPIGTQLSAFSKVSVAGVTLQTPTKEFRVGEESNIQLVFARRYGD